MEVGHPLSNIPEAESIRRIVSNVVERKRKDALTEFRSFKNAVRKHCHFSNFKKQNNR